MTRTQPVIALVYPPACDPTAPYLSVPMLTAYLRANGVTVLPIDANVEAFAGLLERRSLERMAARLEARLAKLERRPSLRHTEQLLYGALWTARGDAAFAPPAIDEAVAALRDPERFFEPAAYLSAIQVVESALRLISAAYAPLQMSFRGYRTPFSLLDAEAIADDALPARNPFYDYTVGPLAAKLRAAGATMVGISVAFPGQLQPAFSLAHGLRAALPDLHIVGGGPALTQLVQPLTDAQRERARGPFDTFVGYEGEAALLDLVRAHADGAPRPSWIAGSLQDLAALPPPDFEGLPLHLYLSPRPVLPYDPTRGCYWGRCAFCHYGLAEVGTAAYRERPVDQVLTHLEQLRTRYGNRLFYFSQDAVNPKTALAIARGITARSLDVRWGTDMRPEPSLTPERSRELAAGGALSMALGVESASPRVLGLIHKGVPVTSVSNAITNLSAAGIAVEAMCFVNFPTERAAEALVTLDFVRTHRDQLSLFFCGEFALSRGSLVAQEPERFGVAEVWRVAGDELGLGLFFREASDPKTPEEREAIDDAQAALTERWWLESYPWAGALSTAHTLLYYDHFGPDCFRRLASTWRARIAAPQPRTFEARYDVLGLLRRAPENEAGIWQALVEAQRSVTRQAYRRLADALPAAHPKPQRFTVAHDGDIRSVAERTPRRVARGRPPGRTRR